MWKSRDSHARAVDIRSTFLIIDIINYIHVISIFEQSRMFSEQRLLYYILHKNNINKNKKHFKNEQRSRDAAAKKRANTSGVGKSNNYYEDIYIPPYTTPTNHTYTF